jgi:hypothetical protein
MSSRRWIFGLILSGLSASAFACPPGYVPWQGIGVTGCAPTGSGNDSGGVLQPPDPGPQWQTRWGAIAIGSGGGFGAVGDLIGKRQAEKSAMKQCRARAKKASTCQVFSYYNQCAVVAWGTTNYTVQGAANIDRATQLAMSDCNQRSSDCQIFYTNCSYPQPVR